MTARKPTPVKKKETTVVKSRGRKLPSPSVVEEYEEEGYEEEEEYDELIVAYEDEDTLSDSDKVTDFLSSQLEGAVSILSRPTPNEFIKERKGWSKDGKDFYVSFIEWHYAADCLDVACPAWEHKIVHQERYQIPKWDWNKKEEVLAFECSVTVRLTLYGVSREGIGTGSDYKGAEHDALKRAASHFGLGRDLYSMEIRVEDSQSGGYSNQFSRQQQSGGGQSHQQQGGGDNRQLRMKNPNAEATLKQRDAVEKIGYREGFNTPEEFCEQYQFDWETLTMGQAGEIISQAQGARQNG